MPDMVPTFVLSLLGSTEIVSLSHVNMPGVLPSSFDHKGFCISISPAISVNSILGVSRRLFLDSNM